MTFASLTRPEPLWRQSVLAPKYQTEGYIDALDRDTLWYDAVWSNGVIHLVCPPLTALRRPLRKARFRGDGVPLKVHRIRRYKRHDVVELSSPQCPAQLSIYIGDWRGESAVSAAVPERLAGRNVLFYVSRNNDLRWLVDHARFHQHHHGVDALIVMDNGSDVYGRADIEAVLAPLGLDVMVLDAPFKYGPVGKPPYRRLEKFMQTALFNVLRLRYLQQAGGILSVDVDELVIPTGQSAFEAARASRLGFVQIAGAWREPAPGSTGPFTHADHTYHRPTRDACPPKWCMAGGSPLLKWSWDVHGIERLPFLHNRTHPELWFAHCRGVTTGWKKQNRLRPDANGEPDPIITKALEDAGLS